MEAEAAAVICPTCGEPVENQDRFLWLRLGKWYCSEACVRQAMARHDP